MGFLSDCYRSVREFKRSIEFHKLVVEMFKKAGNRALEGRVQGWLGVAYRCLVNCERAIESHEEDLAVAIEVGDKAGECRASGNLGAVHRSLGNSKPAIKYHKKHCKRKWRQKQRCFALAVLMNAWTLYKRLWSIVIQCCYCCFSSGASLVMLGIIYSVMFEDV